MTNIMKDMNICSNKCNDDDIGLIKLWNYLKKKIKKISSDDINELKEQNSDNESDKTSHEKNYPRNITRKRNSITSNSSNSSVTSNSSNTTKKSKNSNNSNNSNESKTIYRKRINSMNIIRNDDTDEYDIVLTYQKYIKKNVDKPKKTYTSGTLFDENRIKINNKIL